MEKLREHEPPHRQQHQQPGGRLGRSGSRSAQRSTRGRSTWPVEEMWDVETSVKLSSSPDRADRQIDEKHDKPEVQQPRRCTLRRRARSWPRQGRGWRRAGEPGQKCKAFLTFGTDFSFYVCFTFGSFEKLSPPSF